MYWLIWSLILALGILFIYLTQKFDFDSMLGNLFRVVGTFMVLISLIEGFLLNPLFGDYQTEYLPVSKMEYHKYVDRIVVVADGQSLKIDNAGEYNTFDPNKVKMYFSMSRYGLRSDGKLVYKK